MKLELKVSKEMDVRLAELMVDEVIKEFVRVYIKHNGKALTNDQLSKLLDAKSSHFRNNKLKKNELKSVVYVSMQTCNSDDIDDRYNSKGSLFMMGLAELYKNHEILVYNKSEKIFYLWESYFLRFWMDSQNVILRDDIVILLPIY